MSSFEVVESTLVICGAVVVGTTVGIESSIVVGSTIDVGSTVVVGVTLVVSCFNGCWWYSRIGDGCCQNCGDWYSRGSE